jgi:hypothetical protein
MDIEQARKAANQGAFVAFLSAGFSLLFLAVIPESKLQGAGVSGLMGHPLDLLGAAVTFFAGVGLLLHSRTAALALLLSFVASKALLLPRVTPLWPALLVSGLLLVFYLRGAVGTFRYHQLQRRRVLDYHPVSGWPGYLALGLLGIVAGLSALATGLTLLGAPAPYIQRGGELSADSFAMLHGHGLLRTDERVDFFYSPAWLHPERRGYLLTDRRVVAYARNQERMARASARFGQVRRVEVVTQGAFLADTRAVVHLRDGGRLPLRLSPLGQRDQRFLEALRRRQAAHGPPSP